MPQVDTDDANVPSLLSIPLLGVRYDREIYRATRARILSDKNPMASLLQPLEAWFYWEVFCPNLINPSCLLQYFAGTHLKGIGSFHTRAGQVWPLALIVQAMTAETPRERAQLLQMLLKTQCGNGLMHESGAVRHMPEPPPASLAAPMASRLHVVCSPPSYPLPLCSERERPQYLQPCMVWLGQRPVSGARGVGSGLGLQCRSRAAVSCDGRERRSAGPAVLWKSLAGRCL